MVERDPVEETELFKKVEKEVNEKVDAILAKQGYKKGMGGYCHVFWRKKREVLKNEYGIAWKSPSMMNPFIKFD